MTFGATEAIAAAMLGLLEPGDAVVVLEPFYDCYAPVIAMAGGERRLVTLRPPDFALDLDGLAAAAPGARMLLLNSPHNPTGRVFTRDELEAIARACVEHDLIAVTDEVYEHLVYDGEHIPLATLPGMAERTLTISSAGKSFSFTGWKIGWCSGPPELVAGARAAKQFLSFSGGTPMQVALAGALNAAERHIAPLRVSLQAGRDRLCEGLRNRGLRRHRAAGRLLRAGRRRAAGRERRGGLVSRAARAGRHRRDPDEPVLRRRRGRPHARALRVLQAAGGHRGGRAPARRAAPLGSGAMGALSGSASTEIDAPLDEVWAIVADVESAPAWQRAIDSMRALERDGEGRATRTETVTDLSVKRFDSRLRFAYEPPARLSWVQERGDLKSLTGSWQLEDLGAGRTRAVYALDADPGALLARFLKGALEEKLRAVLIDDRPVRAEGPRRARRARRAHGES